MRAALYDQFQAPLRLDTVPDPEPSSDGVIIEVKANGICRSDWHAWTGHDQSITLPHVGGHEFAGVVREVGSEVKSIHVGQRVTVPFCCGCGRCQECRSGHQHICEQEYQPGFSGWGAFAQLVAIPHADVNLVALPEELDFLAAASLGCRFMTAFHGLVDQARLQPGEWLSVYGCGGVGLSTIMLASALGARVIAIDIDDEKLALARTLGAQHSINAKDDNPVAAVRSLTEGGAHISVDALGSGLTSRQSVLSLKRRGRHVQIGLTLAEERNVSVPMSRVIAMELRLIGSHGMPVHRYPDLLRLISSGRVDPQRLVAKTVSLEQTGEELAAMDSFQQHGVTVIDRF